jgi:hypothetical protein
VTRFIRSLCRKVVWTYRWWRWTKSSEGQEQIRAMSEFVRSRSRHHPPSSVVSVDELEKLHAVHHVLFQTAQSVLGPRAHAIITPHFGQYPSQIHDKNGEIIAFGWVDDKGCPTINICDRWVN